MRPLIALLLTCAAAVCLSCGGVPTPPAPSPTPAIPSATTAPPPPKEQPAPPPLAPPPSPKALLRQDNLAVGQVGEFPDNAYWIDADFGKIDDINYMTLAQNVKTGEELARIPLVVVAPRKLSEKVHSDVLIDTRLYHLPGRWKVESVDEARLLGRRVWRFRLMPDR